MKDRERKILKWIIEEQSDFLTAKDLDFYEGVKELVPLGDENESISSLRIWRRFFDDFKNESG